MAAAMQQLRSFVAVVAATAGSLGIGKNGALPWRLRGDMAFFKRVTSATSLPGKNNAVIMGRKTWESIPEHFRPLAGRTNVVLTRQSPHSLQPLPSGVLVASSLAEALQMLDAEPSSIDQVFVIGGGSVYEEAVRSPRCEGVLLSRVESDVECDTFFPDISQDYECVWKSEKFAESGITYAFEDHLRRGGSTISPRATTLPAAVEAARAAIAAAAQKAKNGSAAGKSEGSGMTSADGARKGTVAAASSAGGEAIGSKASAGSGGGGGSGGGSSSGARRVLGSLRANLLNTRSAATATASNPNNPAEDISPAKLPKALVGGGAIDSAAVSVSPSSTSEPISSGNPNKNAKSAIGVIGASGSEAETETASSSESDKEDDKEDEAGVAAAAAESNNNVEEMQYLEAVRDIIEKGARRGDRTGTGTLSKFGLQMRFSLRGGRFPLLTTKRVFFRGVAEELLWFIAGCTDAKKLSDKGVHIWDGNGSRDFLDSLGLTDREEGDLGPVYGFQWRHFGAEYRGMRADYSGQGVDQLAQCIRQIKEKPEDRRIILSAWNPSDLSKMALPPCHLMCQFHVAEGELSCQMYQRSADMGLGVPFNIASYALLTRMMAHVCDLEAGDFVHTIGDAHVYLNHVEALKEQLARRPRPFPQLLLNQEKKDIDSFEYSDFTLVAYDPLPPIKMKMAV